MPSTFDPTYDTELDAGREPIAAPDAAPAILPPGRRGDRFSQEQASDAEIGATVGQLNAGQPVTALPRQEWSPQQGQTFAAKLDEFDRQAKAARIAAQQAAIDAQMLNQMSMVAKSTKDIEIARRNIDVMGLQRDIQNGVPIHEAVSRHPMGLGSGFAGALRATAPQGKSTWVNAVPGGAPGHFELPSGGVSVPPSSAMGGGEPLSTQAEPITDPSGRVLGYRAATGPRTGTVLDRATAPGGVSKADSVRLAAIAREESSLRTDIRKYGTSSSFETQRTDAINRLGELDLQRRKILVGPPKPKIVAPKSMSGGAVKLRRKADGAEFNYRGSAADVPKDQYDILP